MGGTSNQHFVRRMPTASDHLIETIRKQTPKVKFNPERLSDVLKRSKGAFSITRKQPSK